MKITAKLKRVLITLIATVMAIMPLLSLPVLADADTIPPSIDSVSFTSKNLQQGQSTTASVTAHDDQSGIANVEYNINGVDTTFHVMTYNNATNTWEITLGSDLSVGLYKVDFMATDNAGNVTNIPWVYTLAVHVAGTNSINGSATVTPTQTDNSWPIALDTSRNPAKVNLQFNNVTAQGSGSFNIDYAPQKNQNEFSFSSSGIDWVEVIDSTHASVAGHGNLVTYINGVENIVSDMNVRFDITLGAGGILFGGSGIPGQITMNMSNVGPNLLCTQYSYGFRDNISNPSFIETLLGQNLKFQGSGGSTDPGAFSLCHTESSDGGASS